MAKKAYPLRISPDILLAMQRWADDELRSVNAQIEYVLRESLKQQGRIRVVNNPVTPVPEDPLPESPLPEKKRSRHDPEAK